MKSSFARIVAASIVAAIGLVACDSIIGHGCTDMGCFDGLLVDIQGPADAEYEVVASWEEGESQTGGCVASSDGRCRVWFQGFDPTEVTLNVTGADQAVSLTLQPAYEVFQPNGPDCGPTCRLATVEIVLEASAQLSNTRLEQTR